ncbi:MAG: flagellar basal-body MS-ring/collar protein FliF [Limnochordia bacterium]|nr:flagellar basal-body MS-ring/collar protein FliF [Limnochordia bacterium]
MEMFQQLTAKLKALPRPAKIGYGLVLLLVVCTIIGLSLWAGHKDLVPLFTGLESKDAGEILRKLDEQGVSYKLTDQGTTILVPQEQVHKLRLELAAGGLPSGGVVGFETFTESSIGSTEFDRKVKYTWALQGELVRTLKQLDEVEDVRVHLVIPEQSIFLRDRYEPTASVLVKLRPNKGLSDWQIRGIVNLVASSVEGMKPKNVTVVDTQGNTLSAIIGEEGAFQLSGQQLSTQFQLQQQYERHLEDRLRSLLEQVFGFGRVVTRVNVAMDFDYRETTSETFDPGEEGQLIRSEQVYEETFRGTAEVPGGVVGISANIPTYEQTDENTIGDYAKRDATRNYELNRQIEKTVIAPGKITSCSAAIWVDGELTSELEDSIRTTAMAILGGSEDTPYTLAVYSTAFAPTLFDQLDMLEDPVPEVGPKRLPWILLGVALVVILILMIVLLRRKPAPVEEAPMPEWLKAAFEAAPTDAVPKEEPSVQYDLQKEIAEMYKENPSQVLDALRAWLMEDR